MSAVSNPVDSAAKAKTLEMTTKEMRIIAVSRPVTPEVSRTKALTEFSAP